MINFALDTVRLLLESGADVNLKGENGMPPLAHAYANLDNSDGEKLIQLLLEYGANPNFFYNVGMNSFLYRHGCMSVYNILFNNKSLPKNKNGYTLLKNE